MKITFFTNAIMGGWLPSDLEIFLGGNEQCLVLLCRELKRAGHDVTVFTKLRAGPEETVDDFGVKYKQHETFDRDVKYEALVTYKTREPWRWAVEADLKLHCSADVEAEWPAALLNRLHGFLYLSTYHGARMPWVPEHIKRFVPLALPTEYSIKRKRVDRLPNAMLYATSPDRGLLTLLADWKHVQAKFDKAALLITYNLNRVVDPQFRAQLDVMLQQPGVQVGLFKAAQMPEIYSKASYLVHPLNRDESDLYGYGVLQAMACGVMPVLPYNDLKGTGLQDSVPEWITYRDFIKGDVEYVGQNPFTLDLPRTWHECVQRYWLPLLEGRAEVAA